MRFGRLLILSSLVLLSACGEEPPKAKTPIPPEATQTLSQPRFQEPANWAWSSLEGDFGTIRYGHVTEAVPGKGYVVLFPGYSAPIEIYFETLRELIDDGYGILAFDWPSQGGSSRPLNAHDKIHAETMDGHLRAAKEVLQTLDGDGSLYLLASSMGGQLGTRYMAAHEDEFDAAILITPAYGLNTGDTPEWLARFMANVMPGETYTPGGQDWDFNPDVLEGISICAQDPERIQLWQAWMVEKPELRIGGMTFDFLDAMFESADISGSDDVLSSIDTPILMATAGRDFYIQTPLAQKGCDALGNCELHHYEQAMHCLLEEKDEFRADLMTKIRGFLARH